MRERSVYSINQRRRLEAETTHEREERLQQLSDNQQRKLDTETTAHARPIMHSILLVFIYDVYIQRVFYMHQLWINPFSVPVGEQLSSC